MREALRSDPPTLATTTTTTPIPAMNATTHYTITLGLKDQNGLRLTDEERKSAILIVADAFDAFTLIEGQGYWRGVPEDVYLFKIIARGPKNSSEVYRLATQLAQDFSQEAVMVTKQILGPGSAVLVNQQGTHDSL